MNTIENWTIEWFIKNTDAEKSEILEKLSENYFLEGWIDSLKFILFISEIEDEFQISFSNDEFQNRKFATINGIIEIIKERVNGKK